ncbi:MAG: hypothetical protein LBE48_04670 [Methanomassiliicoccaceae archaeon]|jgi:hypothetical protein|nr:hypothetical protein [Methanomassiliicoccaceae archaeon]
MRTNKTKEGKSGGRRSAAVVTALAISLMVVASVLFLFGNDEKGYDETLNEGTSYDPAGTADDAYDVNLDDYTNVADAEKAIEEFAAGNKGKEMTVGGSMLNADATLHILTSRAVKIVWKATYESSAGLDLDVYSFEIAEGGSIVTGDKYGPAFNLTDGTLLNVYGTLTLNGDMIAGQRCDIYARERGEITVNGNVTFNGHGCIDSFNDSVVTINGNVTFNGGSSEIAAVWDRVVTINGNVTFRGGSFDIAGAFDSTIGAAWDSVVTINGNVAFTGDDCAVMAFLDSEVLINGKVTSYGNNFSINTNRGELWLDDPDAGGLILMTGGNITINGDVTSSGDECNILTANGGVITANGNVTFTGDSCAVRALLDSEIAINGKVTFCGNKCSITNDFGELNWKDPGTGEPVLITGGNITINGDAAFCGDECDISVMNGGVITTNGNVTFVGEEGRIVNGYEKYDEYDENDTFGYGGDMIITGNVTFTGDIGSIISSSDDGNTVMNGNVAFFGYRGSITAALNAAMTINGDVAFFGLEPAFGFFSGGVIAINGDVAFYKNGNIRTNGGGLLLINGTLTAADEDKYIQFMDISGDTDTVYLCLGKDDHSKPNIGTGYDRYYEYTDHDHCVQATFVYVNPTTDVTFKAVQAGGSPGTADSLYIVITFDKDIRKLTINNIIITDGTGKALKGTLSGSGTTLVISLAEVTAQGNVTVSVTNFGIFNVTTGPQTVEVYKDTTTQPDSTDNGNGTGSNPDDGKDDQNDDGNGGVSNPVLITAAVLTTIAVAAIGYFIFVRRP